MNVDEFTASIGADNAPEGLSLALLALWHDASGDWEAAHKAAQAQKDTSGAWVHAYLHRVEGDQKNAGYWYARAGKPTSTASLAEEWNEIARALL